MSNPWFRMYHEFATDPKIQRMPEAYQRRFVMLLCLKCCNGNETLQDEDVTFQLRITDEDWAETKAVFLEKNMIDLHNNPTAWDKRQYVSDVSTSRVKKHREKKKRFKDVPETPPDTDTDTDTDIFKALDFVVSWGVNKQVAKDWLKVRKTKRLANTETAYKLIEGKIKKIGAPANDVIKKCCEKSWGGVEVDWFKDNKIKNSKEPHY